MIQTMYMSKTTKQPTPSETDLQAIKVTKAMHALILKIGSALDEPVHVTVERLIPQGMLEHELQKALREKREMIDRELKALEKKK